MSNQPKNVQSQNILAQTISSIAVKVLPVIIIVLWVRHCNTDHTIHPCQTCKEEPPPKPKKEVEYPPSPQRKYLQSELERNNLGQSLESAESWYKAKGNNPNAVVKAFEEYNYVVSTLSTEAKKELDQELLNQGLKSADSKDYEKAISSFHSAFKLYSSNQ